MTTMASQITSVTVVYSTVYSDADQRKHQSSASLAFVWGIHRDRWIPRTNVQLRGKCFHLMTSSCINYKLWWLVISCKVTDKIPRNLAALGLQRTSKFLAATRRHSDCETTTNIFLLPVRCSFAGAVAAVGWELPGYCRLIFHICVTRFNNSVTHEISVTIRFILCETIMACHVFF